MSLAHQIEVKLEGLRELLREVQVFSAFQQIEVYASLFAAVAAAGAAAVAAAGAAAVAVGGGPAGRVLVHIFFIPKRLAMRKYIYTYVALAYTYLYIRLYIYIYVYIYYP